MLCQRTAALVLIPALLACGGERPRASRPAGTNNNTSSKNNTHPTGAEVLVQVRSYTRPYQAEGALPPAGQAHIYIEADVVHGADSPLPVRWRSFSLQTTNAVHPVSELTTLLSGACDTQLPGRGRQFCPLYFQIAEGAEPVSLIFTTDAGDVRGTIEARLGPPNLCAVPGPEDTLEACTDACNNDGDDFVDCEDSECCALLSSCAPGTFCGGPVVQCVMGPEASIASCKDGCDNDGNSYTDCNDYGCCDVRACHADTSCASRPDPFAGALSFDDAGLASLNPAALLAGPNPCHPPVLAYVSFVRDGDTIEVEPVTGDISGPVRFIGVDTPEVGHDGAPSDCYGDEASTWMQQLRGHRVWLTFDAECKDRFDRNLAYVHLGEHRSKLLQRHLLRRGFARRFPFSGNDGLAELLDNDEQLARAASAGLWTACP